ncbi:MAG: aldo/keto reductase [Actinomycetota bacterium]
MTLPFAPFGGTGHQSSRIIFGAAALGRMSQDRADATLATIREAGVNHIDTAASYGESELRLAPFLQDHREEVFLATKTGERDGSAARAELERSLERMGVDRVDLIQLHNLVEPDEWEVAHGPGGAVEALAAAREEGLVGHVGVTGHGTRIAGMHLRSVEAFDFASVLLPWNTTMMANPDYQADAERLLALCRERSIAVQTIKSIARRRWPSDYDGPRFSWYEALEDEAAIGRAVRYVLSTPDLFLNTTSDARKLPTILAAAAADDAELMPSAAELDADVAAFEVQALFDGGALERI